MPVGGHHCSALPLYFGEQGVARRHRCVAFVVGKYFDTRLNVLHGGLKFVQKIHGVWEAVGQKANIDGIGTFDDG